MNDNPYWRTTIIWGCIMLLGIFGIFAPTIFGLDGFDGGFAISAISLVLTFTALIVMFMYVRLSRVIDKMLQKENLLAHWKYSKVEWNKYTEKEYIEDKSGKKGLFIIIAVISFIIGIIFFIIDPENGKYVFIGLVVFIVFIGIIAWSSIKYDHYQNRKRIGEAYITLDGVYLNRRLHLWKGIGSRLEKLQYEDENRSVPIISFEYSTPGRNNRTYYTVRVPVPEGQQENARQIVATIGNARL